MGTGTKTCGDCEHFAIVTPWCLAHGRIVYRADPVCDRFAPYAPEDAAPPAPAPAPPPATRYVVLTLGDARIVANLHAPGEGGGTQGEVARVLSRLRTETGADMEDIVRQFRTMKPCHACVVEGQERDCNVLDAQKLGRRLRRLLERARGERG